MDEKVTEGPISNSQKHVCLGVEFFLKSELNSYLV